MKSIALCGLALAVASCNLWAQETYRIQAGAAFSKKSSDDSTELTQTMIGGIYYFKPIEVDTSQPFEELDFIQKASGVQIAYTSRKFEDSTFAPTSASLTSADGRFYFDSIVANLGVENVSLRLTTRANAAQYVDAKASKTKFGLGYLIRPNSELGYKYQDLKITYGVSPSLPAINDETWTRQGIYSHTVLALHENQFAVIDLEYSSTDRKRSQTQANQETAVNVKYYPEGRLYFEAGLNFNTGDDPSGVGRTTTFGMGYAYSPRVSFVAQLDNFAAGNSRLGADHKITSLGVMYRY
jgi:hypothetical protein